jgi:hypothetical protein
LLERSATVNRNRLIQQLFFNPARPETASVVQASALPQKQDKDAE